MAFLLCAFVSMAHAQSGTGRISGLVKDASGAVVPGVSIVAVHEDTGVRQEAVTTEAGLFLFPSLPVGAYTVRAELSGFKSVSRTGNLLTVGSDLNLTITLGAGQHLGGGGRQGRVAAHTDDGVVVEHAGLA